MLLNYSAITSSCSSKTLVTSYQTIRHINSDKFNSRPIVVLQSWQLVKPRLGFRRSCDCRCGHCAASLVSKQITDSLGLGASPNQALPVACRRGWPQHTKQSGPLSSLTQIDRWAFGYRWISAIWRTIIPIAAAIVTLVAVLYEAKAKAFSGDHYCPSVRPSDQV
jgi:hypothetical protein